MLSRLSATKIKGVSSQETQESQETEGDHRVRQIPRAPIKKNCLLIDISPDLPTPNILFSPSSQHFLYNFSLLPIVYLPPPYKRGGDLLDLRISNRNYTETKKSLRIFQDERLRRGRRCIASAKRFQKARLLIPNLFFHDPSHSPSVFDLFILRLESVLNRSSNF